MRFLLFRKKINSPPSVANGAERINNDQHWMRKQSHRNPEAKNVPIQKIHLSSFSSALYFRSDAAAGTGLPAVQAKTAEGKIIYLFRNNPPPYFQL
jgi:hypothetical protein